MANTKTPWEVEFLEGLSHDIKDWCSAQEDKADIPQTLWKIADSIRSDRTLNFAEIGDHLHDGVYIADGEGKTLYVNKAYLRITGLAREDVVGKYVQDLVAQGLYKNAVTPEVIRLKKQVNSVGESSRNNVKMLITGNPIFDQNGNVKLVAVIEREVTALLQMQMELNATQRKMKAVEAGEVLRSGEIEHLRRQILNKNLIGTSVEIGKILELVRRVTEFDVTVLIYGETGVGKEVIANEIHLNGPRRSHPFIKVNCAAIPATLLEAELFGYEKGAFTGAAPNGKVGLFELADKGTLMLDEIGDMPVDLQCKLLRILQDKVITRVGGTRPIHLDVRIVAATNRNLKEMVKAGKFREDLFYRLSVFPIFVPPLRTRGADIESLTHHFLRLYNDKYGKYVSMHPDALAMMRRYPWPGNARELQNIVERLVLVSDSDTIIHEDYLGPLLNFCGETADSLSPERGLKAVVDDVERRVIEKALSRCGSTRKAAALLQVDQSTIVKKAKRLGIPLGDDFRHQADENIHRLECA